VGPNFSSGLRKVLSKLKIASFSESVHKTEARRGVTEDQEKALFLKRKGGVFFKKKTREERRCKVEGEGKDPVECCVRIQTTELLRRGVPTTARGSKEKEWLLHARGRVLMLPL